ncbi:hypothetical protein AVEN_9607-1 [Araneus ventricosus]|uniref:Uncharacterized protein n=1 Tax=Araneus ventricosus TaxID=182803 RepID=A0A4Y2KRH5_ARAVE|nr:hypothetical protein AVEN_9607-1 [Araneus ventricosus]
MKSVVPSKGAVLHGCVYLEFDVLMIAERRFFRDFPIGNLTNNFLCAEREVITAFGGVAGKDWSCIRTIIDEKIIGNDELLNGCSLESTSLQPQRVL